MTMLAKSPALLHATDEESLWQHLERTTTTPILREWIGWITEALEAVGKLRRPTLQDGLSMLICTADDLTLDRLVGAAVCSNKVDLFKGARVLALKCDSLDEFLEKWGDELGAEADRSMHPLHVPGRDPIDWLPTLLRPAIPAQAHVVAACAKALRRQHSIGVTAEQGSGKTYMAAGLVHASATLPPMSRTRKTPPVSQLTFQVPDYRALVMCPGHLPKKWKREIENTVRGAQVHILENINDLVALWRRRKTKPEGPVWYVIGKDRAKLSAGWKPVVRIVKDFSVRLAGDSGTTWFAEGVECPFCGTLQTRSTGQPLMLDYFTRNRQRCTKCKDFLWQETREFDRYSSALFIKKKLDGFFDYLVIDEVHDLKGADTAQGEALGFLSAACGKTITLTGTLVGGYAWHCRANLFRVGAAHSLLDQGFGWEDEDPFNEKYGRMETKVVTRGNEGRATGHGKGVKGRNVFRTVRPGIMPTLFGDALVPSQVFVTLAEMCQDLPPYEEIVLPVPLDDDVAAEYARIEDILRKTVAALRNKPGGRRIMSIMLQTLLAYPDYPFAWEEIGYHVPAPVGEPIWVPVVQPAAFNDRRTYAKEEALFKIIKDEMAAGRKCWVFTTMVEKRDVVSRLEQKLNAQGIRSKTLRANIKPDAREEWIAKEGPRNQVLLSHPELVKTGLDFFGGQGSYNFPTIIFYMTGFNSFTLSQASRRAWRIGQTEPCKTYYLFAENTMQAQAMMLMAKKTAATSAISGRFSTEGMEAMAAEDDGIEMAMAKALIEKTGKDGAALRAWEKIIAVPNRGGDVSVPKPGPSPNLPPTIVPSAPADSVEPAGAFTQADLFAVLDDLSMLE